MMNKRLISIIVIALALVTLTPRLARVQEVTPGAVELPPPSNPPSFKPPKMDSRLFHLVQTFQGLGLGAARNEARLNRMALNADNTLRVVIEMGGHRPAAGSEASLGPLSQFIAAWGGRVETWHDTRLQASVPLAALQALAEWPAVRWLRPPLKARPHVVSEGVARTGADDWISQGVFHGSGSNTKVCILDLGFKGYESLLGSELPSHVTTRSFRSDGDIEAGEVHGAACAEIVHDMAPDAQIYLVNFDTDVEHSNAVDWIIQQGVQAISYSIGWTNAGAGDGTGPIDADVDRAWEAGLAWAGSAGNEAESHYQGAFSDPDGDGWHNFSGSDELLQFEVPAYETVGAFLNWDDWGTWNGFDYPGADQDYDLYLYIWNGLFWQQVASSTNPQTGSQWPTEEIYGYYANVTTQWGISIRRAHTTRNCNLEVFIWGNGQTIEYDVPWGSLNSPADSAHCITAGAVDWRDDSYHDYSSRGPTHDGRIKPDFASPSGVSTKTYGPQAFYGTSSSAPHVAGAFGLLLSRIPYSRDQIYETLQLRAVDLGTVGKDNMFGWGRLNLKK